MTRSDGRAADQLRPVTIERGWSKQAEGSALISFGDTRVLCTASFTNGVPRWLTGKGKGWVTAEYAMLPALDQRADGSRVGQGPHRRPHARDLPPDRAQPARRHRHQGARREHHRHRLRRAAGRRRNPHRRHHRRVRRAGRRHRVGPRASGFIGKNAKPLIDSVAAVSVGIIDGEPMLDLAYVEDVRAETDMNVVVTGRGLFVEVQGTAEGAPFDRAELDALLDLALGGTTTLTGIQVAALEAPQVP